MQNEQQQNDEEEYRKESRGRKTKVRWHPSMFGGPLGLGDPDSTFLRKVEQDIEIPNVMKHRAHKEKCAEEVAAFNACCREYKLGFVYWCKASSKVMATCLEKWYNDKDFKEECKQIYLKQRAEYRRTGVKVNPELVGKFLT